MFANDPYSYRIPHLDEWLSFGLPNSTAAKPGEAEVEALRQLARGPVFDGNLISKSTRDRLVKSGLVDQANGFNFLAKRGVEICVAVGVLKA